MASERLGVDLEGHRTMLLDAVGASFLGGQGKADLAAEIAAH